MVAITSKRQTLLIAQTALKSESIEAWKLGSSDPDQPASGGTISGGLTF